MKQLTLVILSALAVALMVGPAEAQAPSPLLAPPTTIASEGDTCMTPEMWFYEQYQTNYANPKARVHANAAFRAKQRTLRMESAKWYGISNARPVVSSDPIHADSGPRWTSGNANYPNRWGSRPWTVISSMTP